MVPLSGRVLSRLDALPPDALVALVAPADDRPAAAPSMHWSTADDGAVDAWGAAVRLEGATLDAIAPAARATLAGLTVLSDHAGVPPPRMFGGQCFDPTRAATDDPAWRDVPRALLVLPTWTRTVHRDRAWLQWAGPAAAARALRWALPDGVSAAPAAPAVRVADPGAQARWESLVRAALAAMADGAIAKLVGARRVRWIRPGGWSLGEVLGRLSVDDGARFALTLAPDVRFVGATPERLVLRRGDTVEVDALAGSIPREADDLAAVVGLLASTKDRHEHALVVAFIADALRALGLAVTHDAVPAVRTLPSVHHLWTPIRARSPGMPDALALAAALHPTPAVAGAPRDAALAWIARHEPDPRGWYAGTLGWCDARGDGRFVVALRSAVIRGDAAWAYVGAGLVPGSDPTREWRETEAKLRTARVALEGPL